MIPYRMHHRTGRRNRSRAHLATVITPLILGTSLRAAELPPEEPLWASPPPDEIEQADVEEQLRTYDAHPESPSGKNRVYSSVTSPAFTIHRPDHPNGVGLVICPGGGFRDVWLDREGHDLALWLKQHNVTSLVLKYRTRLPIQDSASREKYFDRVQMDARQAIRILRTRAPDLGLQPNKIGICGFSAGGSLALITSLSPEPVSPASTVSGMPDFAGLFYPGIPDDIHEILDDRAGHGGDTPGVCPMFIINARVDKLTPADQCVDFYAMLLRAGIRAELHVFDKGSHGFDLGKGAGASASLWPTSFVAWLRDCDMLGD